MHQPKPTVYLIYGDDEFAIHRIVHQLQEKLGDPTTAAMNVQRFSVMGLDMGALEETCSAIPFLSHRRLIILDHAEQLTRDKKWDETQRERFYNFLENIHETTALVLIEHVDIQSKKKLDDYKNRSPLYRWAEPYHPHRAYLIPCSTPKGGAFLHWLMEHCKDLGGEIEPTAAHMLAELVSEDPLLADQEIKKLLDYVDLGRPIGNDDVERLTPFHGQSNVFAMVDAIGLRHGQEALGHLHRLLEDSDPRYAFSMIVRQFRLLLQAREALDNGQNPNQVLHVPGFVADKISAQARNFTLTDIERIYHNLLAIDLASKTSQASYEVELDRLIAELST
jgi:DNA polymerase-3 subunit delta